MDEKPTNDSHEKINMLNGKTILVVDDHNLNRFIFRKQLSKVGSTTIEAENGEDAINKLQSFPIDAIIMDLQMPVMDGYTAIKYIRNELSFPLCNIPILIVTAGLLKDETGVTEKSGADDYLIKPYHDLDLFLKLTEIITKH